MWQYNFLLEVGYWVECSEWTLGLAVLRVGHRPRCCVWGAGGQMLKCPCQGVAFARPGLGRWLLPERVFTNAGVPQPEPFQFGTYNCLSDRLYCNLPNRPCNSACLASAGAWGVSLSARGARCWVIRVQEVCHPQWNLLLADHSQTANQVMDS